MRVFNLSRTIKRIKSMLKFKAGENNTSKIESPALLNSKSGTTVVSICSLSHSDVWKLTSSLLPIFVEAENYFVFVPESEISAFKKITNPQIQILSQGILGQDYYHSLRNIISSRDNEKRFGWYLQQFYKIEALIKMDGSRLVIWDADCVPVKQIKLFNSSGDPIFMRASQENHPVYFETISKLLKISKIQNFSFVIPGFPILKSWVYEFIADLESQSDLTWHESIIRGTPFEEASGFSETETLGTWIANKHPNSWDTIPGNWERHGQRRFGYARDLSVEAILKLGKRHNLDIISFENWDSRSLVVRLKRATSSAF